MEMNTEPRGIVDKNQIVWERLGCVKELKDLLRIDSGFAKIGLRTYWGSVEEIFRN